MAVRNGHSRGRTSRPSATADTAERIARCVADHPLDLGHAQVKLSATVSVASILPGDSVEEVLRRAARNRERVKEF